MIREELAAIDDITDWTAAGSCANLSMLRLDRVHPVISGNKWFKLKHNIAAAKACGRKHIVTLGGGYSNHLVATAAAARGADLDAIGLVRGRYDELTPTLIACIDYGMVLRFLTKADYAIFAHAQFALSDYQHAYFIPEGGANDEGVLGAGEIATFIPKETDAVWVAVGTGTTLAGLASVLPAKTQLHGFCAAKQCDQARTLLRRVGADKSVAVQLHEPPGTRFGKTSPELGRFIQTFYSATGIPLDVVYTGKMMRFLQQQLATGVFAGLRILAIHTGGLQGNPISLFG